MKCMALHFLASRKVDLLQDLRVVAQCNAKPRLPYIGGQEHQKILDR